MESFGKKVIDVVNAIPAGKVMSYGQVAAACGSPRAARQVGWVLRSLPADSNVPWWRVVNNQGVISIKGNWTATKEIQAELLRAEKIEVSQDLKIDMDAYRWKPATVR